MSQPAEDDWAIEEFGTAELGDARRTKRLVALARQLAKSAHCSFPQALPAAQLKAAYRFFDNEHVDTDGVLSAHLRQTLTRMCALPVVLAAADTTEFNLTHLPATEGVGYGSSQHLRGFFMHSALALSPEGLPLGVLAMKSWARPLEQLGKRHRRRQLPIAEKESSKWLETLAVLNGLREHCPDTRIVAVCDREADIYDLFVAERPAQVDWLVRAAWNRGVEHPEQYLWAAMQTAPVIGRTQLSIPKREQQPERTAQLEVRCAPLRIRPPRSRARSDLAEAPVFVVWAIETAPPEGVPPLEWMLLTSVPTSTAQEALERLSWYARRWTIETWHRVLKSGCRIQARQFGSLERFERATALFAVIAWRILYATWLARLEPTLSCEVLFEPAQWQALYCRS